MANKLKQSYKAKVRQLFEAPARVLDKLSCGRLTPNMVSLITFLLHLPLAWLIMNCYLGYGGLMLLLVAPLDLLDGALARVQKRVSDFGTVLDACLDRLKEVVVFGAVGYHLAASGNQLAVAICVLALGVSVMVSYVKAKGEVVVATKTRQKDVAKLNRRFEFGLMGYELRVIILGVSLIADQVVIGLWIILIGACLTAAIRLVKVKRAC